MQITRVHTTLYKTFDTPVRCTHPPSGSRPRPGLHDGPMKLMPPHAQARDGQRTVLNGHGIPIPEGEPLGHPRGRIEHATHGQPVKLTAEIKQPGTLSGNGSPTESKLGNGLAQGLVGGQLRGIHLRKPAPDHQPLCAIGKLFVAKGIEGDDFSTGGGKQLSVLRIRERER